MIVNYIFKNLLFNPIILFSRFFFTIYFPLIQVFNLSYVNHNTLAHSHILSLIYSSILSILSPIGIYMLLNNYYIQNAFITNLSKFIFNLSISYFSVDLFLGIRYYPEILKSKILTFGVHHIVYIGMLIYGRINNLLPVYIIVIPLEIPTVILSIGYINKKYQNYKLFGVLFFIFRIVYNILLIYKTYGHYNDICLFFITILCVHLYWFRSYTVKYLLN